MTVLATKHFTDGDQQRFAALCGDCNPLHVDATFARRTQFGRRIVHGIHVLLWALDALFVRLQTERPASVTARFLKPIFIGDEVRALITDRQREQIKLDITIEDVVAVKVNVTFNGSSGEQPNWTPQDQATPSEWLRVPRDRPLDQIEGVSGCAGLQANPRDAGAAFPSAARVMTEEVICGLLVASYVVGMECPGLHSLLSEMSVSLTTALGRQPFLAFRVEAVDARFRLVRLRIHGLGISGRINAFLRPTPVDQPGIAEIKSMVEHDAFAGHTVLIIGGSRGLGEVTAKIIAAGGGTPTITFSAGHTEATRVAAEIHSAGLRCETMQYDIRSAAEPQIARLPTAPTHFYYFATGAIFLRKVRFYEPAVFREFVEFYVDGFYDLCSALRARQSGSLAGFYPSTLAIDNPVRDLLEYSAAKLAGESLCAQINSFMPRIRIVVRRLPRILTDQTATIAITEFTSPLDIMVPLVREVQSAC